MLLVPTGADPNDRATGHVMDEPWGDHGARQGLGYGDRHWWILHILIEIFNCTCVMG